MAIFLKIWDIIKGFANPNFVTAEIRKYASGTRMSYTPEVPNTNSCRGPVIWLSSVFFFSPSRKFQLQAMAAFSLIFPKLLFIKIVPYIT
jgi:hypothetical protein